MAIHFEELWEQCELFHKDNQSESSVSLIMEELLLKVNLYKTLDSRKENLPSDFQEAKSRVLGEIVLSLTNLSLQENINVYDSLVAALRARNAKRFAQKHQV